MTRIIKKITVLLMAFALFVPFLSALSPGARALTDPAVNTASALLIDLDTGAVLYGKNEHDVRAPASLTKVMTILLAVEAYERGDVRLSDPVEVTEDAFSDVGMETGGAGLKVGEILTFEQLLYCAMISSSNEGCNVIAIKLAGSVSSFVAMMNQRAAELGCTNTNFANTHGLPNDLHHSSAYDLYLITSAALTHNLFKRIVSSDTYTVPPTNLSEERVLKTTNNLINPSSTYYYEYASGVKTGYTDAAGYCLIATATKEGRRLLSVVMGGQSVVLDDGRTQVQSFSETKRLLQWGFDNFSYQYLLTTLKLMAEIPVELGLGADSVVLRPEHDVTALLPNDVDLSTVELEPVLFETGAITAPVEQGRVLGEVSVKFNGVDYGKVNLIANTKIELDRAAYIGSELKSAAANKYVRLTFTIIVVLLILYAAFILYYNVRRRNKRRAAAALARQRVEAYRRSQETTTGKSFEEIEESHRRRAEERSRR